MINYCLLVLSSFHLSNAGTFKQRDCKLSPWNEWSACSIKCSQGQSVRTKNVTQEPLGIFAKGCGKKFESRTCGSDNNGCQMLCEVETGKCHCKSGYVLGSDKKKCYNDDECRLNDGRGACAQRCTDTVGSYKCYCNNGFVLAPDGHACIFNESITCSEELHVKRSDSKKKCVCKNGLDGARCDRNRSICLEPCPGDTLCQTFIHAKQKCIDPNYQIAILLGMTHMEYRAGDKKYQVEEYIMDDLEGLARGKSLSDLRSDFSDERRGNPTYYVESLTDVQVKSSYTYVKLAIMDASDNFQNLKVDGICKLINSPDIRCVTHKDCDILREDGILCPPIIMSYINHITAPQTNPANQNKIKSWVYILISGFAIIIVLLIVLLFMYLKRGKHSNASTYYDNNNMSQPIIFNTEYNALPQRDGTLTSWNNDPYPDDPISTFEAGNTLYDKDTDSLYKSDGQIPIYESIDNLKTYVDKELGSTGNDLSNEYMEPRYLVPRKACTETEASTSNENAQSCLDSQAGPSTKMVENLPDELHSSNISLLNKDEASCSNELVVDISDLTEEGEPRYSSPPGRK